MENKVDKYKDCDNWKHWVGLNVIKHSKKPFRGGNQIEKIRAITINIHTNNHLILIFY